MARRSNSVPVFSLQPVINILGLKEIIRQIGLGRIIDHVGAKEIIKRIGMDRLIASLSREQRRELKARLKQYSFITPADSGTTDRVRFSRRFRA
jgi:hypothetical protein